MKPIHRLKEGIDYDEKNKTVSFNPAHENNVDTSEINNPTHSTKYGDGVEVWSIFARKSNFTYNKDGNPLLYAFKRESGWKFKSEQDREAIVAQMDKIIAKYLQAHSFDAMVIIPSGNRLNFFIADRIQAQAPQVTEITDLIQKRTWEEVDEMVLANKSMFRRIFRGDKFYEAYDKLKSYFYDMRMDRRGEFTYHFIKDKQIRMAVEDTLKIDDEEIYKYSDYMNEKDVLLIDDSVAFGYTIKSACKCIKDVFTPKSISVLTLFSPIK